jgi:DNA-binding FadR family transcriptional regulator
MPVEGQPWAKRGLKVSELVAREIVGKIGAEGWEPGRQLPSETQMLSEYQVGRGSLREALRILEVHGLITLKPGPGGGPVVSGVNTSDFGRMATLYFQAGRMTFRELTEARLIMEPVMARLAAERRADDSVEEILAAAQATELDDDARYLATSDQFHRLVAATSQNSILYLFSHALEDIFLDRVQTMPWPTTRRKQVRAAHIGIAKAIAESRPDDAERLMRDHMASYVKFLEGHYPGLMDEVVDWR